MAERTFTLDEAQALVPVLGSLLKTAIDSKNAAERIEQEFKTVSNRVFLSGGTLLDVTQLAARKRERARLVQKVKDALAEIEAAGALVKDLEMGLLDFPCRVDGRTILLCWKLDEETIAHWHGTDEGYRYRKPIDEKIRKSGSSE
ncbi:MAG TPA: DUF2203 domain-containing protein [Terriglobales bacterium]|jgi:hypothetical protein|nr:DUF2203 domain-containing protein [Terriglobales bacterium]